MTGRLSRLAGGAALALMAAAAALGPMLLPYRPEQPDFAATLAAPSPAHWLGTDALGRDLLARVLAGGRVSLGVATAASVAAALLGVPLGLASGHFGGWTERIVLRAADALQAVPAVLLALAVAAAFGASAAHLALAIAVANLPALARTAHVQARALRGRAFVAATRGSGSSEWGVIWRCTLPNAAAPLLVQMSLLFAASMLTESYLSFLGLGVQPPTPSWGGIVHDGIGFLDQAQWLAWWPGLALFASVLGAVLLSDGLRALFDPGANAR